MKSNKKTHTHSHTHTEETDCTLRNVVSERFWVCYGNVFCRWFALLILLPSLPIPSFYGNEQARKTFPELQGEFYLFIHSSFGAFSLSNTLPPSPPTQPKRECPVWMRYTQGDASFFFCVLLLLRPTFGKDFLVRFSHGQYTRVHKYIGTSIHSKWKAPTHLTNKKKPCPFLTHACETLA